MRACTARLLVAAIMIAALSGCSSSPSRFTTSSWKFWKKAPPTAKIAATPPTAPNVELPSATSQPTAPPAAGGGYAQNAGGTASPFGPPTAPGANQQPPAAPGYDQSGAGGYAATMPPQGGGYAATAMQPQAGFYGAAPQGNMPPATTMPTAGMPAGGPQMNYPAAGFGGGPSVAGYTTETPAQGPSGMGGAGSRYNTGSQYDAGGNAAAPATGDRYADARYNYNNGGSPGGNFQPAQNSYQPAQNSYQPAANGYNPGQNGYTPANTGFQPQAAPQYQSPAPNYQTPATGTQDPNYFPAGTYRPGGTSSLETPAGESSSSSQGSGPVSPASFESAS